MPGSNGRLTLKGLAQILRDHMDGTATGFAGVTAQFADVRAQFAEVRAQFAEVGARIDELRGIVLRQAEAMEEHRREIRQVYFRMEQQDAKIAEQNANLVEQNARIEAMTRDIRRILDTMERRGGNGGSREQ